MADNVTLNSGSGGANVATDDDGTAHHQYVKVEFGADNTQTKVTSSQGLPVTPDSSGFTVTANLSATDNAVLDNIQARASAIQTAIEGTLTVAAHAVTNAGTFAVQEDGPALTALQLIDDIVKTDDAAYVVASHKGAVIMGVFTADTVDAGDAGALAMSADRRLLVDSQIVGQDASVNVQGTVTANLGAVDNAVLDNIQARASAVQTAVEGTLTVTGTVTADLGATDNAVLDTIAANTTNLQNCIVQDDSPFTPATGYLMMIGGEHDDSGPDSVDEGDAGNLRISANRNLYVQLRDAAGNERGLNIDAAGAIGVTNAGTFAVQEDGAALTALQLIDDTVFTDDAVFSTAVNKGTVIMGVATSDAVNAGDAGALAIDTSRNLKVSIEADNVGIGGGTQYTEDDVAVANPVGNQPVMVRADTPASTTTADGDVIAQRATKYGAAYVQVVNSAGSLIDSFSGSGGTSSVDDAAFTVATDSGTPMMGVVTADSVDSGDVGVVAMSADRRLHVDAQLVGQDANITVDLGATDNAVLDNIQARASAIQTAVEGTLTVGSHAVTNAGTFAVQEDGAALTSLQTLDDIVKTDDAAYVVASHKGAVIMGVFTADTVDAGDAGALAISADRRLLVDAQIAGQDADVTIAAASAITVGGTVTANLSATDNTVLDNIQAQASTTATNTTSAQSKYRNVDANAEAAIKAAAGTLHWLHVMNLTASKAYLHLYDASTGAVTPGSTTPDFTFALPTQGDTNGAGFTLPLGPSGQSFANAITLVCTTTIDGSAGDPGTNGVIVNAGYT